MTQKRIYFPTAHVATAESYPYGRLRTTAFFGTEFKPSKGYRSTFQTINPKNGRKNAVKNSTYYTLMVLYQNTENGHFDHVGFSMDGDAGINKTAAFCAENFDLFTDDELRYLYGKMLLCTKGSMVASVRYSGAKVEALTPLYDAAVKAISEGYEAIDKKQRVNTFARVVLDVDAIKACADPNFQAFRTTGTYVIGANGMQPVTAAGHS